MPRDIWRVRHEKSRSGNRVRVLAGVTVFLGIAGMAALWARVEDHDFARFGFGMRRFNNSSRWADDRLDVEFQQSVKEQDALIRGVTRLQELTRKNAELLTKTIANLSARFDSLQTAGEGNPANTSVLHGPGFVDLHEHGAQASGVRLRDFCKRRKCAKQTQCLYANLEQQWSATQPSTLRFDKE